MCGLTGFWDPKRRHDEAAMTALVGRMASTLYHRGPDRDGAFADARAGLAFGFRRLSINDLSIEGQQPMQSNSGRWTIMMNGEIYNFRSLRQELEARGEVFHGHSDTEVLLALIERDGVDAALERCAGMFAFAVWDAKAQSLTLARDRIGKKPLYLGWIGDQFVFGSELKALCAHPGFDAEVDRDALALFLHQQFVPAPKSIWRGIMKLRPGTRLTLTEDDLQARADLLPLMTPYWCAREVAEQGSRDPLAIDDAEAIERVDALLSQAVAERMVADVPLGAFLSGGIDSSLIVAYMQKQASRPVRTFTVGFNEADFSEAEQAREVARLLGTEHTEFFVTPDEALAVVPNLADIYDEPFADPSQIPTYHVARLARSEVTVCLSGDGGDEVFAGYGRYQLAARLENRFGRVPYAFRRMTANALLALSPESWDGVFAKLPMRSALPHGLKGGLSGDRLHKLADLMRIQDPDARYAALVSAPGDAVGAALGGRALPELGRATEATPDIASYLHRMMYYDTVTYLPDDILVKVDRASMAVSLEARSPLLDHRLLELAWQLPASCKLRDGKGKWLLRELFNRHLPPAFAERPKQGFGVPIADWLRGPLKGWAEALIEPDRLRREGFLDADHIATTWREHQSGARNWHTFLWSVLMFQAWHARWIDQASSPSDSVASAGLGDLPERSGAAAAAGLG
ncbi:MAG: asparagine synthase (glutamine-hydrolyzing) [Alphaproteobacteria bacterium]|nr:asparagine synthase (glutamine-hydrolyzing) [Alphaproteobacteria bacterium]